MILTAHLSHSLISFRCSQHKQMHGAVLLTPEASERNSINAQQYANRREGLSNYQKVCP